MPLAGALSNCGTPVISLIQLLNSGQIARILDQSPRAYRDAARPQKRLNAEEIQLLVADYEAGEGSIYVLAERYGVHRQTIAKHLKNQGCALGVRPLTSYELTRIGQLSSEGWSPNRIGISLGRDPKTVRKALELFGSEFSRDDG